PRGPAHGHHDRARRRVDRRQRRRGPAGDALRGLPRAALAHLRAHRLAHEPRWPVLRGHVPRGGRQRWGTPGGARAAALRRRLRQGDDHGRAHLTLVAAGDAGVRLAMGFDSAPLRSAANELLAMVDFGLAPHDALVAATSGGAYALGLLEEIGTIEPGKRADLLVVDGDPLA